jgi:hypothetical protein
MRWYLTSALVLSSFLISSQVYAAPVRVVSVSKRPGKHGQRVPIEMLSGASINAYMPGVGRLKFRFNDVNPLSNSVAIEGNGTCDQKPFSALRGEVTTRRFRARASAIGIQLDGEEYLRVSFVDPTRDPNKLYRVQIPLKRLKDAHATSVTSSSGNGSCATASSPDSGKSSVNQEVLSPTESDTISTAEATALRVASISTFADKAWSDRFGSLAAQQVGLFAQEAELVYKEQLNMRFRVENIVINVFDSVAKAGSSDASAVLNVFSNYVRSSSYYKQSDLYHLLTGVDLAGSTIGIAYVGVLCKSPDYVHGVSSFTNNTVTPVTMAHELGHNFGADHSSSGIMKPAADGEGLSTLRFSSDSVAAMTRHLQALHYSCTPVSTKTSSPLPTPTVTPAPTATPKPTSTPTPNPTGVTVGLSVTKQGDGRFGFTVKVDKARSGCRLAMQYSFDQQPWGTFSESTMSGTSLSGNGRFASSSGTPVRVSALYSCGTSISKRSNIESIIPGKI